jgi:uncharacterized protein YwqG
MFSLPISLEPWREKFALSLRPYLSLSGEVKLDLNLNNSKFGGYPYLPKNTEIPKDTQDNPMTLLAQINWQQTPALPDFPTKGITQFFIAQSEDFLYGIDFKKPTLQKNWRIVHYPEIEEDIENLITDFSFLPNDRDLYERTPFQFQNSIAKNARGMAIQIEFELKYSPVLSRDYEFAWHINAGKEFFWSKLFDNNSEKGYQILKEYDRLYPPFGHKIGGYAGFTQDDWRTYTKNADLAKIPKKNPWLLLLQIQSDSLFQWGDCGIANFFIRKQDLLALNFAKVRYHWDCV